MDGNRYPRLTLRISNPEQPDLAVDTQAYLDSRAERTLFSGWIGAAIGIDVLSGRPLTYETTSGSQLTATVYPIRLAHPELGEFDLEPGFSSIEIKRNLLSRDFFNLIQIVPMIQIPPLLRCGCADHPQQLGHRGMHGNSTDFSSKPRGAKLDKSPMGD